MTPSSRPRSPRPLRRVAPAGLAALAAALLAACAAAAPSTGAPSGPPATRDTTAVEATTTTRVARSTAAPRTTTSRPTTTTSGPTTTSAPATVPPSGALPVPDGPLTPARPGEVGDAFAAFDASLAASLDGRGTLAASVAVAKDGRLVHTQAFGVANPLTGEAATPASRFRIASVSKTLLAAAVLRMVERGELQLDQPVLAPLAAELEVAFGDPAMAGITLRQLLAHTSAFPEYQRTFFGGTSPTCEHAAARGLSRGLIGPPGTVYRYSNLNYCLLGLLVEQHAGKPYQEVVQEEVLSPLGIRDMRVAGTFDVRAGDVLHPTGEGRVFMEALGASGNWIGTASDLVKVLDALDPTKPGPHLLSPEVAAEMAKPAAVTYPHVGSWYGLGLIVWDNGATWGHTGTVESARTMVLHRPDGITWAILVNGPSPSHSADLRKLVDKALATVTEWPR